MLRSLKRPCGEREKGDAEFIINFYAPLYNNLSSKQKILTFLQGDGDEPKNPWELNPETIALLTTTGVVIGNMIDESINRNEAIKKGLTAKTKEKANPLLSQTKI